MRAGSCNKYSLYILKLVLIHLSHHNRMGFPHNWENPHIALQSKVCDNIAMNDVTYMPSVAMPPHCVRNHDIMSACHPLHPYIPAPDLVWIMRYGHVQRWPDVVQAKMHHFRLKLFTKFWIFWIDAEQQQFVCHSHHTRHIVRQSHV